MSNTEGLVSVFAWLRQLLGLKNKDGLLPEEALKAELILGLEELKTRHSNHPKLLAALNQEVAALTAPSCQGIAVKKVCRDLIARFRTPEYYMTCTVRRTRHFSMIWINRFTPTALASGALEGISRWNQLPVGRLVFFIFRKFFENKNNPTPKIVHPEFSLLPIWSRFDKSKK